MAKLGISTGTTPDDGTGDSLLDGAIKINSNFSELYTLLGDGTTLTSGIVTSIVAGSNVTVSGSTGQVTVNAASPKNWETTAVGIHTLSNVGIGTTNPTSKLTVTGSGLFTGVVTATSFSGSGSNLTGIVTGITAGANITVLESPSGNFIITSTSSGSAGAGGTWATTSVGIHTLKNVGIGTTNPTSALTVKGTSDLENVTVSGVSTFNGITYFTGGSRDISISANGVMTFADWQVGGANMIRMGDSNDLNIYHDGTKSIISETGTGNLEVQTSKLDIISSSSEYMAEFVTDGAVNLYYNNSKKFETLGTGVTVTGTTFTNQLNVSGISTLGNIVVGGATTQLVVNGDARVTGILTVGTSSITLNGSTNQLLVGTGVTIYGNTGIVSATKFYGDGSSITGVIAAGVGITVRDGGGDLGSAEVIDFGDNLTVSFSSGIATVTGSAGGGGSSQWVTTAAGIHTLSNVGIGTTNPTSPLTVKGNTSLETLSVSGVSTFQDDIYVDNNAGIYLGHGNEFTVFLYAGPPAAKTVVANNVGFIEVISDHGLSINNGTYPYAFFNDSGTALYHTASDIPAVTLRYATTTSGTNFYKDITVRNGSGSAEYFTVKTEDGSSTTQQTRVGIATTNPITQLQVGRSGTQSGFGTFSASVGVSTTIDTFETSFLTAEYTVHIGYGTYIQAQKVLVMNNGSTAYSQEYAIMYEPSQIVSVGATVSGANVLLQVTPQTGVTGLTTYRFVRNSLI